MPTIPIHEAQSRLAELIRGLGPGDEVILTEGERPVARLMAADRPGAPSPPGFLRGSVREMAPDFDEPFEDFREYME